MKRFPLYLGLGFFFVLMAFAFQNNMKNCDDLYVNIDEGTLNGISPAVSVDSIKKIFPCFTGDTEEGSEFNCGGGVFYLDNNFFFYSYRDYLEIRSGFKGGTVQYDLFNKNLDQILSQFGEPDSIINNDIYLFKKKYGVLRINFIDYKISEIGIHYKDLSKIELCL